jgi:hypothetical protein
LRFNPGVEIGERTRIKKDGTPEIIRKTIYTTLRNEVGHTNKDTPIEKVIHDMKNHIETLEAVVKQAIIDNL